MSKECVLCILEERTVLYYEDNRFIILDCMTCKIPMIVSRAHDFRLIVGDGTRIYKLIRELFPGKKFTFRTEQRNVKNHWHWHIIFEE